MMVARKSNMTREERLDGTLSVSDAIRLMTRNEFEEAKAHVLPVLRARHDPPPRIMNPGSGDRSRWYRNVKDLLARTPGGVIVRGYKLFVFPLDPLVWASVSFKAQFHVVVGHVGPSGKQIYTCANSAHCEGDSKTPFVFVPSSRAHTEVSDVDLLENKYVTGCIVGGNATFTDALVLDKSIRGRRYSVISTCPESCVAKRNVKVRTLPYFSEWFKLRGVKGDMHNLAEQFGMPSCNVGDEGKFDEENLDTLCERVQSNPEALINGLVGVRMELDARCDLFTGATTLDEVRQNFFLYYDESNSRVKEILEVRLSTCQSHQKLK